MYRMQPSGVVRSTLSLRSATVSEYDADTAATSPLVVFI